jgi:hypothetical protein
MCAYKLAMDIHGESGRVARYISAKFKQLREQTDELLSIEDHWDMEYLAELDLAANILHQAMENQSTHFPILHLDNNNINVDIHFSVSTDWNIVHYADNITGRSKIGEEMEKKLMAQYKPIFSEPTLCIEPGIVTDLFGKILVWYLPTILHPRRQVCMQSHLPIQTPH